MGDRIARRRVPRRLAVRLDEVRVTARRLEQRGQRIGLDVRVLARDRRENRLVGVLLVGSDKAAKAARKNARLSLRLPVRAGSSPSSRTPSYG
jgi:hypothetical protein